MIKTYSTECYVYITGYHSKQSIVYLIINKIIPIILIYNNTILLYI